MRTIILSPRAVEIYKQREIEHGNDPFIFFQQAIKLQSKQPQ